MTEFEKKAIINVKASDNNTIITLSYSKKEDEKKNNNTLSYGDVTLSAGNFTDENNNKKSEKSIKKLINEIYQRTKEIEEENNIDKIKVIIKGNGPGKQLIQDKLLSSKLKDKIEFKINNQIISRRKKKRKDKIKYKEKYGSYKDYKWRMRKKNKNYFILRKKYNFSRRILNSSDLKEIFGKKKLEEFQSGKFKSKQAEKLIAAHELSNNKRYIKFGFYDQKTQGKGQHRTFSWLEQLGDLNKVRKVLRNCGMKRWENLKSLPDKWPEGTEIIKEIDGFILNLNRIIKKNNNNKKIILNIHTEIQDYNLKLLAKYFFLQFEKMDELLREERRPRKPRANSGKAYYLIDLIILESKLRRKRKRLSYRLRDRGDLTLKLRDSLSRYIRSDLDFLYKDYEQLKLINNKFSKKKFDEIMENYKKKMDNVGPKHFYLDDLYKIKWLCIPIMHNLMYKLKKIPTYTKNFRNDKDGPLASYQDLSYDFNKYDNTYSFKNKLSFNTNIYNKLLNKRIKNDVIEDTNFETIGEELFKNKNWFLKGNDSYLTYFYNNKFVKKLLNGKQTVQNKNNVKIIEGIFKSGKLHGKGTIYYKNGDKKEEGVYKNGRLNGKGTLWYIDNKLKVKGTFKDGKLIGENEVFHNRFYYNKDFKKLIQILKFKGNFKEGLLVGEGIEYYTDGTIYRYGNFVKGKLNGEGFMSLKSNGIKYYSGPSGKKMCKIDKLTNYIFNLYYYDLGFKFTEGMKRRKINGFKIIGNFKNQILDGKGYITYNLKKLNRGRKNHYYFAMIKDNLYNNLGKNKKLELKILELKKQINFMKKELANKDSKLFITITNNDHLVRKIVKKKLIELEEKYQYYLEYKKKANLENLFSLSKKYKFYWSGEKHSRNKTRVARFYLDPKYHYLLASSGEYRQGRLINGSKYQLIRKNSGFFNMLIQNGKFDNKSNLIEGIKRRNVRISDQRFRDAKAKKDFSENDSLAYDELLNSIGDSKKFCNYYQGKFKNNNLDGKAKIYGIPPNHKKWIGNHGRGSVLGFQHNIDPNLKKLILVFEAEYDNDGIKRLIKNYQHKNRSHYNSVPKRNNFHKKINIIKYTDIN
jgi:ribosomal protein S11